MVSKAELTSNSADTLKLAGAGILVLAGLVGFYYFGDQSLLLRVIALLIVAGLAALIIYQTDQGGSLNFSRTHVLKFAKLSGRVEPKQHKLH
jgi:preprotein translocase subunit SecE